ncbi:endonuclease/exonuclease/phosphatase family protein [Agrobacterium burrii]|uniref:Endonuclease/exonuclease/phosphatase family protein n=1 Tax=Agrobacterium burrii TaxID=2815339 RepID=A0ABS3EGP5_9HYPH|nr:endonuclease/exonuclease/phosphatase family protein [Agrobacterium burrii]MBO0130828.1 endonuclease/exonuclease/phosphatase family protein [Agrobacterium burrii]
MTAKLACMVSTMVAAVLFIASLRYVTDFWLLAFVTSFQLHIAIVCILLSCLVFWFTRDAVSALLVVWSLALAIHAIAMLMEFSTSANPASDARPFRLLSFNVLMDNGVNADAIADTILESGADAVYLFEAAALQSVLPRLEQTYPHRLGCYTGTPTCDLLILSKRPLLEGHFHSLSDLRRDRFAIASVDFDGTELTLAAGHITKPYFDDYHAHELDEISEILFRVTGPLILAGDFNSASIAPDMRAFLAANDLKKAPWEPATWPTEAGRFGIAIDHIFAREPATLMKTTRLPDSLGSNHYGLMADFMIGR